MPKGHNRYGNPQKQGTLGYTNHAMLRDRVVETSGYHKYEVEDVMMHLVAHMQKDLSQGIAVKLDGIGWFSRRSNKPRKFRDLFGVYRDSISMPTVSLKIDGFMRTVLKKAMPEYFLKLKQEKHLPEDIEMGQDLDVTERFRDNVGIMRKRKGTK